MAKTLRKTLKINGVKLYTGLENIARSVFEKNSDLDLRTLSKAIVSVQNALSIEEKSLLTMFATLQDTIMENIKSNLNTDIESLKKELDRYQLNPLDSIFRKRIESGFSENMG